MEHGIWGKNKKCFELFFRVPRMFKNVNKTSIKPVNKSVYKPVKPVILFQNVQEYFRTF